MNDTWYRYKTDKTFNLNADGTVDTSGQLAICRHMAFSAPGIPSTATWLGLAFYSQHDAAPAMLTVSRLFGEIEKLFGTFAWQLSLVPAENRERRGLGDMWPEQLYLQLSVADMIVDSTFFWLATAVLREAVRHAQREYINDISLTELLGLSAPGYSLVYGPYASYIRYIGAVRTKKTVHRAIGYTHLERNITHARRAEEF